jgi:hypothetical protein
VISNVCGYVSFNTGLRLFYSDFTRPDCLLR